VKPLYFVRRFAILGLLFCLIGCGPRYHPVEGKVVWKDGSAAIELQGGSVEFESEDAKRSARGVIDKDGAFRMSSLKPGDGLLVGNYKVVVIEPPTFFESPVHILDPRFCRYATSNLNYTVKASGNKDVVFEVERAKQKPRE